MQNHLSQGVGQSKLTHEAQMMINWCYSNSGQSVATEWQHWVTRFTICRPNSNHNVNTQRNHAVNICEYQGNLRQSIVSSLKHHISKPVGVRIANRFTPEQLIEFQI